MSAHAPLSQAQLASLDGLLPAWSLQDGALHRELTDQPYSVLAAVLAGIAKIAIAHKHHPTLTLTYNTLSVRTTTHDAGDQLTELDLRLALACESLISRTRKR